MDGTGHHQTQAAISPGCCIEESLGLPWAFRGGVPLTELETRLIFFVRPLSKLCVSDAQLRVREKHAQGKTNLRVIVLTDVSDAILPLVNARCHLEQSLSFRTIVYCRFHEEDKALIAEIQLILTLTLTLILIQTKINFKRRN